MGGWHGHYAVVVFGGSGLISHWSVPWNDDRLIRDDGQIPLGCADHSVDTASGRVVDERIKAVPPCVSEVNNVSLFKQYGDIASCVGRSVILQSYPGVVVMQMVFVIKHGCRKGAGWRRRKGIAPAFNTRGGRKTFSRILVRCNRCSCRMHPGISICVIDMPMSIYQLCEGVRAQAVESCRNSRS